MFKDYAENLKTNTRILSEKVSIFNLSGKLAVVVCSFHKEARSYRPTSQRDRPSVNILKTFYCCRQRKHSVELGVLIDQGFRWDAEHECPCE